jgi:hypothetical protein
MNDNDAFPCRRQIVENRIDLIFGPDVVAGRQLVQDDTFGCATTICSRRPYSLRPTLLRSSRGG